MNDYIQLDQLRSARRKKKVSKVGSLLWKGTKDFANTMKETTSLGGKQLMKFSGEFYTTPHKLKSFNRNMRDATNLFGGNAFENYYKKKKRR